MNNIEAKQLEPTMYNLKGWIEEVQPETLNQVFNNALLKATFKVLNCNEQHFPLNGYTAFWILAESHLAIHTFTDSGWCYFEISSCNGTKTKRFMEEISNSKANIKWVDEIEVLHC